jgi:hypothetical protein
MKLQFSLATLLVCMTVLAVVCAAAVSMPVREPLLHWDQLDAGTKIISTDPPGPSIIERPPNFADTAIRLAIWGAPAIATTLSALWAIRLLKSRRKNGPSTNH